MIYKLISDTKNYLGFYFDEDQIDDIVEELGDENIDNFIKLNHCSKCRKNTGKLSGH